MSLPVIPLLTLQTRLAQAQEARHQLMVGGGVVSVRDQNGETVEYRASTLANLDKYIAWLESAICGYGRPRVRGPMIPIF